MPDDTDKKIITNISESLELLDTAAENEFLSTKSIISDEFIEGDDILRQENLVICKESRIMSYNLELRALLCQREYGSTLW